MIEIKKSDGCILVESDNKVKFFLSPNSLIITKNQGGQITLMDMRNFREKPFIIATAPIWECKLDGQELTEENFNELISSLYPNQGGGGGGGGNFLPLSHNTDVLAHPDIRAQIENIKLIAEGASVGYVFDTVQDMMAWTSTMDAQNAPIGSSLFIRESDVPDYWWDGTNALPSEAEKVNLSGYLLSSIAEATYVMKEQGKSLMTDAERTQLNDLAVQVGSIVAVLNIINGEDI